MVESTTNKPAAIALMEMIGNGSFAQAIYVAADLAIADVLAAGPMTAADIAEKISANADAVHRLLRLLSSRGVFALEADGRYALNELSDPLRSDAEVSVRPWSLFVGSPEHREHWSHLSEGIRTGEAVVPAVRGVPFFEFTRQNPAFGKVFNDAQTSVSGMTLKAVLGSYDFSRYSTIVDVGGGHGRLLSEVLLSAPDSSGVLYDLPAVVDGAQVRMESLGLAERCTVQPGSFFESVPAGGDAYILKHIIHDWNDADSVRILRNICQAMSAESRLILIEIVLPEGNTPHLGLLTDLNLLALFGGKERTEQQYRDLFTEAGLTIERVLPTGGPAGIIEARVARAS
ncbi:methyltransferase [Nocardia jejuensis]|uniref:methyltransferase n=1 Tax=Nocardia jejuensis TaxID=328049 RepID=UPI000A03D9F8|nr:methyltransferase [Nocardia jejuensis]